MPCVFQNKEKFIGKIFSEKREKGEKREKKKHKFQEKKINHRNVRKINFKKR